MQEGVSVYYFSYTAPMRGFIECDEALRLSS